MKVLHVILGMEKAAGTSVFCAEVCNGLVADGHEVTIAVASPNASDCYPFDSRIKLISIYSLLASSFNSQPSLIHIHGLWSALLHKSSQFAKKHNIPVVWSTHGMTAPWSMRHKWWKKLPAWWLYQKRDLKHAVAIHCTTEQEVEWNKSLGFTNCFIAPLGTHLPKTSERLNRAQLPERSEHILLFVGRIYPVKGLVNLIKAWKLIKSYPSSLIPHLSLWKLRIVGPDQAGHQAELESLVRELSLSDSVEFAGPKFGENLSAEYDKCDCLVLPSFTENFGATIVDALAHSKPCIASSFTPWRDLQKHNCGWWVSNEAEQLGIAIKDMILLDDASRRAIGENGRRLVEEKYSWGAVVPALIKGYSEVLNGGTE